MQHFDPDATLVLGTINGEDFTCTDVLLDEYDKIGPVLTIPHVTVRDLEDGTRLQAIVADFMKRRKQWTVRH